jgi:hypothetical protein
MGERHPQTPKQSNSHKEKLMPAIHQYDGEGGKDIQLQDRKIKAGGGCTFTTMATAPGHEPLLYANSYGVYCERLAYINSIAM